MGPEGGEEGGQVMATGTPEEVAAVEASHTGEFLRGLVKPAAAEEEARPPPQGRRRRLGGGQRAIARHGMGLWAGAPGQSARSATPSTPAWRAQFAQQNICPPA